MSERTAQQSHQVYKLQIARLLDEKTSPPQAAGLQPWRIGWLLRWL